MTGPMTPPRRASDADRERAVRTLRDAAVDGRLSQDSFVRRVDVALRARHDRSLAGVTADLERAQSSRRGFGAGSLLGRFSPQPVVPTLPLPDSDAAFLVVGRSRRCDVVVGDPTVSREHAGLVRYDGQWFVCDRDSTNGTCVNGRRIWGTASVRPGDLVSFGEAAFRLTPPE